MAALERSGRPCQRGQPPRRLVRDTAVCANKGETLSAERAACDQVRGASRRQDARAAAGARRTPATATGWLGGMSIAGCCPSLVCSGLSSRLCISPTLMSRLSSAAWVLLTYYPSSVLSQLTNSPPTAARSCAPLCGAAASGHRGAGRGRAGRTARRGRGRARQRRGRGGRGRCGGGGGRARASGRGGRRRPRRVQPQPAGAAGGRAHRAGAARAWACCPAALSSPYGSGWRMRTPHRHGVMCPADAPLPLHHAARMMQGGHQGGSAGDMGASGAMPLHRPCHHMGDALSHPRTEAVTGPQRPARFTRRRPGRGRPRVRRPRAVHGTAAPSALPARTAARPTSPLQDQKDGRSSCPGSGRPPRSPARHSSKLQGCMTRRQARPASRLRPCGALP